MDCCQRKLSELLVESDICLGEKHMESRNTGGRALANNSDLDNARLRFQRYWGPKEDESRLR